MMQYDPTQENLYYQGSRNANQYPLVNQQQFRTGNIYQPYQPPQSYISYPAQPFVGTGYIAPNVQYFGQVPIYSQSNVIIAPPVYNRFRMNQIITPITHNLRIFLIISGIIYIIWSMAIIGLELAIVIESHWTFYRNVWASCIILAGGICMLTAACGRTYSMITLIRIFIFALLFCLLGVTLSAINYGTSIKCTKWRLSRYSCDNEIISILKITSLTVSITVTIHTVINMIVICNEHKKASLKLNVQNH